MIATLLAALGFARTDRAQVSAHAARRVRWRGSDGRWHWQGA